MLREGATVVVLRPGRTTLLFELSERWPLQVMTMLLALALMGAAGRSGWDALRGEPHRTPGSVTAQRPVAERLRPVRPASPVSGTGAPMRPPRQILSSGLAALGAGEGALARMRSAVVGASREGPAELAIRGVHFDESLRVQPFDARGAPRPEAFGALDHLMRCRVTGEEVAIDPGLVRLLMLLSALYERPIEVISGHRSARAPGTRPTSQHVLGRAADIRIEDVPIRELRRRAVEVGARGVGLYPERGFLHVDVRTSARYYWGYTEATGELPYDRFLRSRGDASWRAAPDDSEPASGELD